MATAQTTQRHEKDKRAKQASPCEKATHDIMEYYSEHPDIDSEFVFDALQLAGEDAQVLDRPG